MLGGHCLTAEALELADKVSQHCNVTLFAETFKARFQRGAGRVMVKEIPYPVSLAIEVLAPFKTVITVCAKTPVGFFAYPDKPSKLCREDADVLELAGMYDNGIKALRSLVEELGAQELTPRLQENVVHTEPTNGPLTSDAIGFIVANQLPQDAIVIDEAVTSGVPVTNATASAAAHDWLGCAAGLLVAVCP